MAKPLRILLADDHQIVLEGLRRILESDFQIAGIASDGQELVRAAAELKPDVIIADITMPLLNGLEAARQVIKSNPDARVVFLTMHPDVAYAMEALDTGALGYVLKSSAGQELVTAIREAMRGRVYVTLSITSAAVRSRCGRAPQRRRSEPQLLPPRQREVARLFGEGRTTKDIATLLHLSARTVEFHKYRAMDTLGLRNAAELIQYAVKHFA